jgi:ketosteroid isomerase-like protein
MSERDLEVLRLAYDAFNRRDLQALLEFFDPGAHWVPSSSVWGAGTAYHGHEGVERLLADLAANWDRFEADPQEFREVGDLILVTGRVHALAKGGAREIDSATAWVWQMREGKALLLQAYADAQQARDALGLVD